MAVKFQVYFYQDMSWKKIVLKIYILQNGNMFDIFILEFIFLVYFFLQKSIFEVVASVGT